MNTITIIIIAISLSMDAFSLALIYGTQKMTKKDKLLLSLIVGIYHFIMPIIGLAIGILIMKKLSFNSDIVIGIILIAIAIEMIISKDKEAKDNILLTTMGYLIFGLSVSIDSLTTGMGLSTITNKYLLSSIIFSVTSFSLTLLGLTIGNYLNKKYGKIATLIGGIILLIFGLYYII